MMNKFKQMSDDILLTISKPLAGSSVMHGIDLNILHAAKEYLSRCPEDKTVMYRKKMMTAKDALAGVRIEIARQKQESKKRWSSNIRHKKVHNDFYRIMKEIEKKYPRDAEAWERYINALPEAEGIAQLMNELNISTEDMTRMADGRTIFLSNVDAEDLAKVGALYKLNGVDKVNVSLFIGEDDEHKVIVTEGKDGK